MSQLRANVLSVLCVLSLFAAACTGEPPPEVEPLPPAPPAEPAPPPPPRVVPEPVVEPEPVAPPALVESWRDFPLWGRSKLPADARVPVPVGQVFLDAAVHPTGAWALVLTRDADRDNVQWHRWSFSGPLESVPGPDLGDALATELAWDVLDGGLYVLRDRGGVSGISRCDDSESGACKDILSVDGTLAGLRVPLARWENRSRAFATLSSRIGRRVVSVRADGSGAYDLTHPAGTLSELTAPELRQRVGAEPWDEQPPRVWKVSNAALVDIDPADGAAWLHTPDGLRRLAWDDYTQNWAEGLEPAPGTGADAEAVRLSRNGGLRVEVSPGAMRLVDRAGSELDRVMIPPSAALVDVGSTGRCALLHVAEDGLHTACFDGRAARVRHLDSTPEGSLPSLFGQGLAYGPPVADRLFEVYEPLAYATEQTPVFASVDGMLAVLHAGMQAVFLDGERTRSAPALEAFLQATQAAAVDPSSVVVAQVGLHLLGPGLAEPHPDRVVEAELVRIRAGGSAESPHYGGEVDYSDDKPRGPYAGDPELEKLFRASKAVFRLQLSEEARSALVADPAVVAAWQAWTQAQSPFLMGTRQPLALGEAALPPWVHEGCLPTERRHHLFPLAWGPDSEVIERLTAHDALPAECGVNLRPLPSGLDLFAALGSTTAESILLTSPEGRYPELPERLAAVKARPLDAPGVTGSWLSVVQALAQVEGAPSTVEASVWQRRLIESGLSSWVDLRHLLVLVTERGGAQAGDGAEGWFEELRLEPAHSAVDPLPKVWASLAISFEKLAARIDPDESKDVRELLQTIAEGNRSFADIAQRQMAGEALSPEDYDRIHWYVREIEWPLLRLAAQAGPPDKRGRTSIPPPDARIVDIHLAAPPDGPQQVFHIARGRPRPVTVLLEDRGVAVPAQGAVGSYYEVVDGGIVTDADWLERLDSAPRPHWLNPDP